VLTYGVILRLVSIGLYFPRSSPLMYYENCVVACDIYADEGFIVR